MSTENYARTAVDRLQPRIPASLYEIAWQYSLLDWYDAMLSDDIDWDLSPEHLAYLTPRAKSELFGQDDSLVVVYVDLSDPSSPTLRGEEQGGPVEITAYTEADRFRVGHAYPANKTSSMTDYSVTTHKEASARHLAGLRDDAWGTNNIQDRFTGWARSEYAEAVLDRTDDEGATVLEALAELGENDDEMRRLSNAFLDLVKNEDEELDVLITIRVRLPGEREYKYPGEVPVLNEVMKEKKAARLENISVEAASDEGVGYVTNESGQVTGGSPGLFGMYGKKQREHFPGLDTKGSDSWRTRPLEFDTAAAIAAADSIFEDFYRGLGQNRRLYVLPYLADRQGDVDSDVFEWFYEHVFTSLRDAEAGPEGTFDDDVEQVMRSLNEEDQEDGATIGYEDGTQGWEKVRVATVLEVTGNPDRVFLDTLDATSRPALLEDAHNRVTASPVFRGDGIFAGRPPVASSPLLGRALKLHRYILYGGYFERTTEPTRSSREAQETPTAGDIDDHRMRRVRRFLTGERISQRPLLEEYLHKLVQDQQEAFASDEEYVPFPKRSVVEQYVQLRALTDSDAVTVGQNQFEFTTTAMTGDDPENREERLEQFIEGHDALSTSDRKAVFLLGGLVGRVTAYQHRKDISSTLVRRYPIDYLTKQTVQEVTKEVLQMDSSYAEADQNRSYWANSRYHEQLADTMLDANPAEWSLTEPQLQWLYSLGIAYGLNDTEIEAEETDDATES